MKLTTLLRRLGIIELARRAGVSPSTVKRWVRQGPSPRGQDALDAIAARHRRSRKGASTRLRRQRETFRDRLPVPVSPDLKPHRPSLGQFDDPLDLVPDKPPVETEEELDRISRREGHDREGVINTDTYEGESYWFEVGKPVVEMERTEVSDTVWQVMKQSSRIWAQVIFLFFRFIPFNPLYKGDELERFQGKWKPWWWATKVVETESALHDGIDQALDAAKFAAENRMIWCQGFKVRTMTVKPDAPRDWRERQLRRQGT